MTYLIDTNIWIDYFKANPKAVEFVTSTSPRFVTSYIVLGELAQGARDKSEQKIILGSFLESQIDFGSSAIHIKSLMLLKEFNLSHGIGFHDSIIAATAIVKRFTLATLNLKHFSIIPKLKVIRPY